MEASCRSRRREGAREHVAELVEEERISSFLRSRRSSSSGSIIWLLAGRLVERLGGAAMGFAMKMPLSRSFSRSRSRCTRECEAVMGLRAEKSCSGTSDTMMVPSTS
jgi:hypothetical protein